jgi:ubiquinone biosynthesis monooxygenase Coq7
VEEAIDEHYAAQIEALGDDDPVLKQTVAQFRSEEIQHRDTALAEGAEQAPGYRLFSAAVKAGCRVAIKLSERI